MSDDSEASPKPLTSTEVPNATAEQVRRLAPEGAGKIGKLKSWKDTPDFGAVTDSILSPDAPNAAKTEEDGREQSEMGSET